MDRFHALGSRWSTSSLNRVHQLLDGRLRLGRAKGYGCASFNLHRRVSDGHLGFHPGGSDDTNRRTTVPLPLSPERWSSPYAALGAMASGGESHPYLGFGVRREGVTRARDDDLLPCTMDFDEGGALVIF
jgi:hypothetical protein